MLGYCPHIRAHVADDKLLYLYLIKRLRVPCLNIPVAIYISDWLT